MAQCDYCGRQYDEREYQVVIQSTNGFGAASHRSFDTVECAVRGNAAFGDEAPGQRSGWIRAGDETTLARLEQTAAELFMARTLLEEERRRREDLERQTLELLGAHDQPPQP